MNSDIQMEELTSVGAVPADPISGHTKGVHGPRSRYMSKCSDGSLSNSLFQ